jgi:hypothetical protein
MQSVNADVPITKPRKPKYWKYFIEGEVAAHRIFVSIDMDH